MNEPYYFIIIIIIVIVIIITVTVTVDATASERKQKIHFRLAEDMQTSLHTHKHTRGPCVDLQHSAWLESNFHA